MKWISFEPHTHTNHSDALYHVDDLLNAAHNAQLDVITLTDHNTDSGMDEIPVGQTAPVVLPGIEWTTFYGHVVVTAPEHFVEWRDLTCSNLDEHLRAAHEAGAVVQMAHPCCPGEPFCCGCHWDFDIPDWRQIDVMEVWSEGNPMFSPWNEKAYQLWNSKWKEGFRPMAISARDWHEDATPDVVFGVNYLYIDEKKPVADAVKEALRNKRAYMTAGPKVDFMVKQDAVSYGIGDVIEKGRVIVSMCFSDKERVEIWRKYELDPEEIILVHNDERIAVPFPGYGVQIQHEMMLSSGFFYMELQGKAHQKTCRLLITNPLTVI